MHASMPDTAGPVHQTDSGRSGGTLVLQPLHARSGLRSVLLRPGKYTFGSSPECTVTLSAEDIQPLHCLILVSRSRAVIKAWDPRTWLNEGPVAEDRLRSGDRLAIGPVEFQVREASAQESETSSGRPHPQPSRDRRAGDNGVSAERRVRRKELIEARRQLDAEREQLARQQRQLQADRDALSRERSDLAAERDRLARQCEEVAELESRVRQQQEELRARRAGPEADRDGLNAQRGRLGADAGAGRTGSRASDDLRLALEQVFGVPVAGRSSTGRPVGGDSAAPLADRAPIQPEERRIESELDSLLAMFPTGASGNPPDGAGRPEHGASPVSAPPRPGGLVGESPGAHESRPTTVEEELVLEDAEDPGSVAAYMESLLARARDASGAEGDPHDSPPVNPDDEESCRAQPSAVLSVAAAADDPDRSPAEPGPAVERLPSGCRNRPDKETVRAELDSLRDVANQTAQSAIARYASRKLWRRIVVDAVLSAVALGLCLLFWSGGQPGRLGDMAVLGWPAAAVAALAVGELLWTVLVMVRIRRPRTAGLSREPDTSPATD